MSDRSLMEGIVLDIVELLGDERIMIGETKTRWWASESSGRAKRIRDGGPANHQGGENENDDKRKAQLFSRFKCGEDRFFGNHVGESVFALSCPICHVLYII